METDQEYYRRRAAQEEHAAQGAACAASRERHRALAALYRARSQAEDRLMFLEEADGAPEHAPQMTERPNQAGT